MPRLVVPGLACQRGERTLFAPARLRRAAGEIVWIRGANGQGKTTLLRTLAGLAAPDGRRGSPGPARPRARRAPLYLAHANALKDDLTAPRRCASCSTLAARRDAAGCRCRARALRPGLAPQCAGAHALARPAAPGRAGAPGREARAAALAARRAVRRARRRRRRRCSTRCSRARRARRQRRPDQPCAARRSTCRRRSHRRRCRRRPRDEPARSPRSSRRDLRLAGRRRVDAVLPIAFFTVAVSLFPLGVGPEAQTLRQIAPGVVWVARCWRRCSR